MSYPITRPSTTTTTTTSTIQEFICLFTHDLKRKTKRWQDGRLKFHLFNSRIMVYDDRGGNVGDAHFTSSMSSCGSDTLEEGDEFDLDRGGAIVQVCERTGSKEVDLESLVDRRARDVEKRRREAAARTAATNAPRPGRALNSMGTPARIGRAAIPKESPFEQRMAREREQDTPQQPPAKRQKRERSPLSKPSHARALFGTQLTLTATGNSLGRSQVLRDRTNVRVQTGSSQDEGRKESARATSVEEEESLFVEEDVVRRPTVSGTSSRLGGLRIERATRDSGLTSKPVEPGNRQPAARPSFARPLPRASSPEETGMDEDDEPTMEEPESPISKRTKAKAPSKVSSRQPTARSSFARPLPRASNPQDLIMDDDDDGSPEQEPEPPVSKKSKAAPKSKVTAKPTITSPPQRSLSKSRLTDLTVDDDDSSAHEPERAVPKKSKTAEKTSLPQQAKSRRPAREETAHDAPRSRVPTSPPRPTVSNCSKPSTKITGARKEAHAPKENCENEKRTELRIKKGRKRGLLMLAQPEPPREAEEQRPEPEPLVEKLSPEPKPEPVAEKSSPKSGNAGFEAWLDEDEEADTGLGAVVMDLDAPAPVEAEEEKVTQPIDDPKERDGASSPAADITNREESPSPLDKITSEEDLPAETSVAQAPHRPPEQRNSHAKDHKGKNDQVTLQNPSASPPRTRNEAPLSSNNDSPPPKRRLRSKKQTAKVAFTLADTSPTAPITHLPSSSLEDDWTGPAQPKRNPRRSSAQVDEESPVKKPATKNKKGKNDSGIRVSRISRNCKSKVITGFVERESEGLVPDAFMRVTGWGDAAGVLAAEKTLQKPVQEETVLQKSSAEEKTLPRPLPKEDVPQKPLQSTPAAESKKDTNIPALTRQISNPATRGRKAASKADAAGQVLQVSVPFEQGPQLVRKAMPSTTGTKTGFTKNEFTTTASTAVSLEKRERELPGFAKANGGAWSRHADDLLGRGRPRKRED